MWMVMQPMRQEQGRKEWVVEEGRCVCACVWGVTFVGVGVGAKVWIVMQPMR